MNDIIPTESTDIESTSSNGLAFVMPNNFPDLDQAEIGMRIEKKYFEFKEVGQRVRAIFNGMDFITSKNNGAAQRIPAIVFQTRDGIYLHSGASLVEQFRTIPAGTPVQITYQGKEKTGSGNSVNKFDVHLLKVGVTAVRVESSPEPVQQPKKPEQGLPSSPGNPGSIDGIVFQNDQLATEFWSKARSLGLDRKEGMAHLKEFSYDFQAGLEALNGAVSF